MDLSIYPVSVCRRMHEENQIIAMLIKAEVMTFDDVIQNLNIVSKQWRAYQSEPPPPSGPTTFEIEVSKALARYAVVVQGVWVIKSRYCKPVLSDHVAAIRNFIMLNLALEEEKLTRHRLVDQMKASADVLKRILERICVVRDGGWVLARQDDKFAQKFPDVVSRFKNTWKKMTSKVLDTLTATREKEVTEIQKNQHKATKRANITARTAASNEDRGSVVAVRSNAVGGNQVAYLALREYIQDLLRKYGVLSINYLRQEISARLNANDTPSLQSVPSNSLFGEAPVFTHALVDVADSLNDAYFLKTCGDTDLDKIRYSLVNIFKSRHALTRMELTGLLKEAGSDIPSKTFNTVVKELCVYENSKWRFRTGNSSEVNSTR